MSTSLLRNTQASVVPEDEKLAIIQEAKSQALAEIVKRAKTIYFEKHLNYLVIHFYKNVIYGR